jgi:beta-glucosidase
MFQFTDVFRVFTENGACFNDVVWEGAVHDLARLDYVKQHLAVLPGLIESGIPLKGYFYTGSYGDGDMVMIFRQRYQI